MTTALGSEWTTLRAGGAVAHHSDALNLDLRPRVMLSYTARVRDAASFDLFAGGRDPEELTTWLGQMLVQVCATYLAQYSITTSLSGAIPLAEEVTPLANAECVPLGLEVTVTDFMLSLSEDDKEAVDRAAEAAARERSANPEAFSQLAMAEAMMAEIKK